MKVKDRATRIVRRRYDRIAPVYDYVMRNIERGQSSHWRSLLWSKVEGKEILEVGTGTGQNFLYADAVNRNITAIDLSDGMLRRARARAAGAQLQIKLLQMDVQNLQFQGNIFDTVIGSFLFCSVPNPLLGLMEIKRVCKHGGRVLLLEHGLSESQALAWLMNMANPLIAWVTGAENINRKTEDSVTQSGLQLENVTKLDRTGIFKLIEARKK
jgi:phosphatidylethanolamine/phosphatidyl-N-methylethanolamine N-methyltransferase